MCNLPLAYSYVQCRNLTRFFDASFFSQTSTLSTNKNSNLKHFCKVAPRNSPFNNQKHCWHHDSAVSLILLSHDIDTTEPRLSGVLYTAKSVNIKFCVCSSAVTQQCHDTLVSMTPLCQLFKNKKGSNVL
jgi:hypothetical protein